MDKNELIEEFARVYRETLIQAQGGATQRKSIARTAAMKVVPDLDRLLKMGTKAITTGKVKNEWTQAEAEGYLLMRMMSDIVRSVLGDRKRSLHAPAKAVVLETVEGSTDEEPDSTFMASYTSWVEEHGWVPTDKCVAHFSGFTGSAASHARGWMKTLGWEFEKRDNVWWVIRQGVAATEKTDEVDDIVEQVLARLHKRGLV